MTNLESHPIAARYPLLEGDEFEAFKASVKTNKQRIAIVLFQGKILDGRNRYRACVELGIAPKTEVFIGTEAEAAVLSDVLNLDRRHLTREQKRAVIAYKLKANPECSDRAIAAEVKASPSTVSAVRKSLESGVQVGHLNAEKAASPPTPVERTVKGKDNKKYTVKPSAAKTKIADEWAKFERDKKAIQRREDYHKKGVQAATADVVDKQPLTPDERTPQDPVSDVVRLRLKFLQDFLRLLAGVQKRRKTNWRIMHITSGRVISVEAGVAGQYAQRSFMQTHPYNARPGAERCRTRMTRRRRQAGGSGGKPPTCGSCSPAGGRCRRTRRGGSPSRPT